MKVYLSFRSVVVICATVSFAGVLCFISLTARADKAGNAAKAAEAAVTKAEELAERCRQLRGAAEQLHFELDQANERLKKAHGTDEEPARLKEQKKALQKAYDATTAANRKCGEADDARDAADAAIKKAEELLKEKTDRGGNVKDDEKLGDKLDGLKKRAEGLKPKPPTQENVIRQDAGQTTETETANGLHTITFDTKHGHVRVNLPDDIRAGDTISGTVVVEPKGSNEAERSKNRKELSGFVVELRPPVTADPRLAADTSNNRIQRVNPGGSAPPAVPTGAVQNTLVFVGDTANNRLQRSMDGGRTWEPFPHSPLSSSSSGAAPQPQTSPRALLRSMDGGKTWQAYSARANNSTAFTLRLDQGAGGMDVTLNRLGQDSTPLPGEAIAMTKFEVYDYPGDYPDSKNAANSRPVNVVGPPRYFNFQYQDLFANEWFAQQGRPIEVFGRFDGGFDNTGVRVGGQEVTMLAESPRKLVFESPTNVTGLAEMVLKEGEVEIKGTFRNIGVRLTAPKTNLMRGEKTTLTVEVRGLEGIQKEVPLQLDSKGVITMDGGNFQNLRIKPQEVQGDGRYTTTRDITGVQPGGFTVTATVIVGPFDVCLQDDSVPSRVIRWNTFTGDYDAPFRTDDIMPAIGRRGNLTGIGNVTMKGCIITLTHNAPDRRVFAKLDACTKSGEANVQTNSPKADIKITDKNTTDNTAPSPPPK